MTHKELSIRLGQVVKKKEKLSSEVERLKGQQEAAQKALHNLEEDCRARKVDPDKLDDVVSRLETRLEEMVSALEEDIAQVELDLAPYTTDREIL